MIPAFKETERYLDRVLEACDADSAGRFASAAASLALSDFGPLRAGRHEVEDVRGGREVV